ncbi:ATP-binding cassette domain-containing protein [Mastigocoleus testarum]|uniref:ABC transporter n=1 Tax=Mastigocoleus testarum BC008 TaxID=371196 RepID=A0A0V8A0S0_9CYAN|nr:ATP-binding cassette domain-containing protein [Mastigocoleus testarum]KST70381.1 ABC transporter [Mastigocoleus testarum BC008]
MQISDNPIINIRNLDHYFGKKLLRKQVLFDINLAIQPGEIVILTGPSGSGKTTLLSLIGGLRSAKHGSVKVLEHELVKIPDRKLLKIRRQLGYIFQGNNLVPFFTARQNVQMTLELKRISSGREIRRISENALESVGLKNRVNYYPDKLSEGQKQRVAIARALVTQPKVILADEPTASLDKNSGRAVVEILQKLAKTQGSSILLVTHDNRILDIADRIVHMEDGRLIQPKNLSHMY